MLPKRPKTPSERVAVTIERFALDLPERPVGVWIADLRLLLEIVFEAEQVMLNGTDYATLDRLCYRIGQYHGQEGHAWGAWQEPYEAGDGEWFRYRVCQRCHEYVFERCDAPTEQDGAS